MTPGPTTLEQWKQRLQRYEQLISSFEKSAHDMRVKRNGANDTAMLLFDARLKIYDRMIKSMRMGRDIAEREIKRIEDYGG